MGKVKCVDVESRGRIPSLIFKPCQADVTPVIMRGLVNVATTYVKYSCKQRYGGQAGSANITSKRTSETHHSRIRISTATLKIGHTVWHKCTSYFDPLMALENLSCQRRLGDRGHRPVSHESAKCGFDKSTCYQDMIPLPVWRLHRHFRLAVTGKSFTNIQDLR